MSGTIWAVMALVYAGLAAICAGYDRHRRQLWPGSPRPNPARSRALALAGWLMLALSLVMALNKWSGGVGWVMWFGLLSAATAVLVVQLAYRPRRVPMLASVAAGIAVLMVLWG